MSIDEKKLEIPEDTEETYAPCDHQWESFDDSYDDAYGTVTIRGLECSICGEVRDCDTTPDDRRYEPDYDGSEAAYYAQGD